MWENFFATDSVDVSVFDVSKNAAEEFFSFVGSFSQNTVRNWSASRLHSTALNWANNQQFEREEYILQNLPTKRRFEWEVLRLLESKDQK